VQLIDTGCLGAAYSHVDAPMVCSKHLAMGGVPYGKRKRKRARLPCIAQTRRESKTHERVASPHCDDRSSTLRDGGTNRAQNLKGDERLLLGMMCWMREGVACLGQG
jgi:hypothetical protein